MHDVFHLLIIVSCISSLPHLLHHSLFFYFFILFRVIFEQERKNQVAAATANLAKQQADYDRSVAIAKIEAENAAKLRNTEMQQVIEKSQQLIFNNCSPISTFFFYFFFLWI